MTTDEAPTQSSETHSPPEAGAAINSALPGGSAGPPPDAAPSPPAAALPIGSPPQRIFRPPTPGQVIDSGRGLYVIGESLGGGSYGTTYECIDSWDNQLAVKVLQPSGTYETVRIRFEREVQSLIRLRHPNITFVYDAFEFEDTFYIVMERCAGSLRDLFRITEYQGLVWLMPVARCLLQGVSFLHENSVVHRDIHPGNVLYTFGRDELVPQNGQSLTFKLADFGVSRLETDDDFTTASLAQWMLPPEVIEPAEFGSPARQMDVYHCALVLLAVVTGKEPSFTREEILTGAPRLAAEALDDPCGAPLARALRRHVAARTASPYVLWQDLVASGCLPVAASSGAGARGDATPVPSPPMRES